MKSNNNEVTCLEGKTHTQTQQTVALLEGSNFPAGESLKKFINFIQFHQVEPSMIWKNDEKLSISEFARRVESQLGFQLTSQDLIAIMKLTPIQTIRPDHFLPCNIWKQQIARKTIPFKNNQNKLNLHFKSQNQDKLIQTTFSSVKRVETLNSKNDSNNGKGKELLNSKSSCLNQTKSRASLTLNNNFFKSEFLVHECLQNETCSDKIENLKKDLQINILQNKWDLVVMAGEMNKWAEEIKQFKKNDPALTTPYQIINQIDKIIISKEGQHGEIEVISDQVFLKKYRTMKKKFNDYQLEKKNRKSDMTADILKQIVIPLTNPPISKSTQRDQELNEVLLHVMRLRSIFAQQSKFLTEAGVNSN